MNNIPITDDINEIIGIGDILTKEYEDRSDVILNSMRATIAKYPSDLYHNGNAATQLSICVYNYAVYGTSAEEFFSFGFNHLPDERKKTYITDKNRFAYYHLLNDYRDVHILNDKYETYEHLSDYFHREVVLIDEFSYDVFVRFTDLHPVFFVKPTDLWFGLGIQKVDVEGQDRKMIFEKLIKKRKRLNSLLKKNLGDDSVFSTKLVLEEIIQEHPEVAKFNPESVGGVRIPTILQPDGMVVIFYPWFRVGAGEKVVSNGGAGGIISAIDKDTGVVTTKGADEASNVFECHPKTGYVFEGFKIPQWDQAVGMVTELAKQFPTIRYVGWDLALTKNGWCVIEANPEGQFLTQIPLERGLKSELENISGLRLR